MFDNYNDILEVDEVCLALKSGKNTVYGLLKSGQIKSIKIGKTYKIPKNYLIDFIQEK